MPVSKRLKDCILEHEELMEDMEGLRISEHEVQKRIIEIKNKLQRKSEEIYNEMRTCFVSSDSSKTGFVNRRVVLIGNKAYLLILEPSGSELRVKEIPLDKA